jgi:HTH-type transcriptional regulator/antitoxin HigA
MTKITTEAQYNWAVKRVEELLPLVTDETPVTAPESIELEILSNLVADYSDEHFSIGDMPVNKSAKTNIKPETAVHVTYA